MVGDPKFSGCHKSKFLWKELCSIQLQSGPEKYGHGSGSHYINTVLPTVTMEENERRRDGVPEKKAEVPRSGKRATGYFWTDEITGIHCMLEWMKSGTNFL